MSAMDYMLPLWRSTIQPITCRWCRTHGHTGAYHTPHGAFCGSPCAERWAASRAMTLETGNGIGDDDHWLGVVMLEPLLKKQVTHVEMESYHALLAGLERMVIELSPALRAVHYDESGNQRSRPRKNDRLIELVRSMVADADTARQEADMVAPTACGW